jgi:hypothetical protein
VYVENQASDYFDNGTLSEMGGANQQMRVDVMDPGAAVDDLGAGVLQNLFITLPGDPLSIGYTTLNADLSAYAGQTVRIRIAEVDNQFFFQGAVDEVSVDAVEDVPTMPSWAYAVLAAILILETVLIMQRRLA